MRKSLIFPPEIMISDMEEGDLEEVMVIERAAFPAPWSENMFRQELHFPLSRLLTARVAGQEIVGYITFWIIAGDVHLHNIAVKKDRQR
ncbi:MAG TPA: GNAT family N-acetyltransferase, partial [Syntrophales bacterium]|nr:GNAT family N-acetyltransferase [Syntrophales bacterium]